MWDNSHTALEAAMSIVWHLSFMKLVSAMVCVGVHCQPPKSSTPVIIIPIVEFAGTVMSVVAESNLVSPGISTHRLTVDQRA